MCHARVNARFGNPFPISTTSSAPAESDPTKSATYDMSNADQSRLEPVSSGDFVTPVTRISSLISTAQEALRTGDFCTLAANLSEIGLSADDLHTMLKPQKPAPHSLPDRDPKPTKPTIES